jgi:hypothetical protein
MKTGEWRPLMATGHYDWRQAIPTGDCRWRLATAEGAHDPGGWGRHGTGEMGATDAAGEEPPTRGVARTLG